MGLRGLPGEDLVREGLRDLSDGIESPAALLVSIGAPRARRCSRWRHANLHTGGATAVLYGWRASTIDVDLKRSCRIVIGCIARCQT
jgi:hypothetical protein